MREPRHSLDTSPPDDLALDGHLRALLDAIPILVWQTSADGGRILQSTLARVHRSVSRRRARVEMERRHRPGRPGTTAPGVAGNSAVRATGRGGSLAERRRRAVPLVPVPMRADAG